MGYTPQADYTRFVAGFTRALTGLLAAALFGGCAVTSPYWGYVPDSIDTPIPFQAWATNSSPLRVECANDTNAHGNPSAGDASYVLAGTLTPSDDPSLDSAGNAIYSASAKIELPDSCWKYFGSYDFWQANVRVMRTQGASRYPLTTYDLNGLECVGRENGKVGRWYGFLGKNCEKKYLGTNTNIPYIVLRIQGHQNGLSARSRAFTTQQEVQAKPNTPKPDALTQGLPRVTQVPVMTKEQLERASTQVR